MENPQLNQISESRNGENRKFLLSWHEVVRAKAEKTAVFAPSGEDLSTFAQLEDCARAWADRFKTEVHGNVIAIQTGNLPEFPALILGIWYAGKIALPLDPDLMEGRRTEVEALCGVTARIEPAGQSPKILPLRNAAVNWPDPVPDLLKLTSGTSATPRVIRFTGEQLLADCEAICATMGLREHDVNYGVISFSHSYGFSNLITPLLFRGIPLVAAADMIPQAVRHGLVASQATVLPGVPALFRAVSGLDGSGHAIRLCISAGAPLTLEIAQRFHQRWGLKVHTFYGSSECGGICYDASNDLPTTEGFVGQPMRGASIRPLKDSWPCQVEVRSAAVGEGYYPAKPGEELQDGAFRPSDLLSLTPEGYVITGRATDLINVSGRKVNPAEIEQALLKFPKVRETIVVGIPATGARGEEVAACVVGEASEEELRAHCATALPAWQVPRRWLFLPALPINSRGKISRPEIRALF